MAARPLSAYDALLLALFPDDKFWTATEQPATSEKARSGVSLPKGHAIGGTLPQKKRNSYFI